MADVQAIAATIRKLAPGAQLASDSRRIKLGDVFFALQQPAVMPPTAATSSKAPSSRAPP
jgi:DNA-binding IscR family transcriptional regulator